MRSPWPPSDEGSTLAEFAATLAVLASLFLALLQLGVVLNVRNTLRADAAEGARVAASADRTPAQGAARALALADASFGGLRPTGTAGNSRVAGVPVVWVRLDASVPLVGWLAGTSRIRVTAHALDEQALR